MSGGNKPCIKQNGKLKLKPNPFLAKTLRAEHLGVEMFGGWNIYGLKNLGAEMYWGLKWPGA